MAQIPITCVVCSTNKHPDLMSSGDYGNSYSSDSVYNESASTPPRIISKEGNEIGKLSIGSRWDSPRYDPNDIKYTCDWD